MSANNNPTNTIIKGAWDSAINGPGPAAVRCVYMVNTSSLIGFTLAQGATLLPGLLTNNDHKGAGVLAAQGFAGDNIIISNCVIISNWSGYMGGGVSYGRVYNSSLITNKVVNRGGGMYAGTMFNSVVSGNTSLANGGGMYSSVISNCTIVNNSAALGGGAFWGTLNNCVIANNSASASGGGTYLSALYNCLVTGNSANPSSGEGGGATTNSLHNCTIVSNSAKYGSGVSRSTNINCIIYNNSTNNWYSTAVFSNSCTTPTTTVWEAGNITNDPMFVNAGAGNYHLRMGSPCVNTGTNQDWMINAVDLDGNARILNTIVDMGAYETILRQGTIIVIY